MRHALIALLALLPALSACSFGPKTSPEDREAVADCRQESDRIFAVRNRYELSERDTRDTPYAANTLPAAPSEGLRDQYERDQLLDSCLARSSIGNTPPAATTPSAP